MRPYGWNRDGTIIDDEADQLRYMADWVARGEPVLPLIDDLNDRGIQTVSGKPWRRSTIKQALLNPRIVAKREKNGELVDADNQPILDDDVWQKIRDIFADPERQKFIAPKDPKTRPLLAGGILRCECGGPMYGTSPQQKGARPAVYQCRSSGGDWCNRRSIVLDTADAEVTRHVLARLVDPRLREDLATAIAVAGLDEDRKLIAQYEARQRALGKSYGDLEVDEVAFVAASQTLAENLDAATGRVRVREVLTDVPEPSVMKIASWWEAASMDARREVIDVLVRRIDLKAKVAGEPDRLRIDWRYWPK